MSGNKVTGSVPGSGFQVGIAVGYGSQVLTTIGVEDNTVQMNESGIEVRSSAGGVTVNYTNISGNALYGVENAAGDLLNAEYNWWGDASGPGGQGLGSGDAVSMNVDYIPWYITGAGDLDTQAPVAAIAGPAAIAPEEEAIYSGEASADNIGIVSYLWEVYDS